MLCSADVLLARRIREQRLEHPTVGHALEELLYWRDVSPADVGQRLVGRATLRVVDRIWLCFAAIESETSALTAQAMRARRLGRAKLLKRVEVLRCTPCTRHRHQGAGSGSAKLRIADDGTGAAAGCAAPTRAASTTRRIS